MPGAWEFFVSLGALPGHTSRAFPSPDGPFKLMSDHDIKVLRDRIRATSEVGPLRSQLRSRGYDIPAVYSV